MVTTAMIESGEKTKLKTRKSGEVMDTITLKVVMTPKEINISSEMMEMMKLL